MSEEKEHPYRSRPLKSAGSKLIEEVISKALSEMTGYPYKVDVVSIDFEPYNNSFMNDAVEIKLNAKYDSEKDTNSEKKE